MGFVELDAVGSYRAEERSVWCDVGVHRVPHAGVHGGGGVGARAHGPDLAMHNINHCMNLLIPSLVCRLSSLIHIKTNHAHNSGFKGPDMML